MNSDDLIPGFYWIFLYGHNKKKIWFIGEYRSDGDWSVTGDEDEIPTKDFVRWGWVIGPYIGKEPNV